jgi:DtxR family Mn-dependent transcriptional regulator
MHEDGAEVIQARLAERLGVTPASVSTMVKRLYDAGLVEFGPKRTIQLTKAGLERANATVLRHRVVECLLVDVLGIEWYLCHEEAAKLEHAISDRVVERILEVIGDKSTCPHGNPIPGRGIPRDDLVPISEVSAGSQIVVERLTETIEENFEWMLYLGRNGIDPGRTISVVAIAPDGTLTLDVGGSNVALGAALAENIYVSVNRS